MAMNRFFYIFVTKHKQQPMIMKEIYVAGGCFWGTEHFFKQIDGVVETEVGFANGITENPTYKEVYTDTTQHAETVHIVYDSSKVDLEFLLNMFFKAIDPTSLNKQGEDVGTRYRTGVYYTSEDELPIIEKVFKEQQALYEKPLAVEVKPLKKFYKAEELPLDHPNGQCDFEVAIDEDKARNDLAGFFENPIEYPDIQRFVSD